MKRYSLLALASLLLVSCMSYFTNSTPPFAFDVSSQSQDNLVAIRVPDLLMENRVSTGLQVVGLKIVIKNNSDKPLTIKWSDSVIAYKDKPDSPTARQHAIFLSGHFYSDVGKNIPDSPIPPGDQIEVTVVPADNVPAAGGYGMENQPFNPIYARMGRSLRKPL
jgi:hypothetical protein